MNYNGLIDKLKKYSADKLKVSVELDIDCCDDCPFLQYTSEHDICVFNEKVMVYPFNSIPSDCPLKAEDYIKYSKIKVKQMTRTHNSVFSNIGASSHSRYEREANDYYATDPLAIDLLEKHNLLDDKPYWECACGDGRLSERLKHYGYDVVSSDLFDRGYGEIGVDFLNQKEKYPNIITNPPYTIINDFIVKGIELATNRLYIFARLQTLETSGRWNKIFRINPPSLVCPFVKRIPCYRGGGR